MATERANTLNKEQLKHLLNVVETGPCPIVDRVKVLLSFTAGLRAQEIVGLRWDKNILNAVGDFKTQRILVTRDGKRGIFEEKPILFVGSDIGKYGRERTIVMAQPLVDALKQLKAFKDAAEPKDRDEEELLARIRMTPHVIPPGKRRASGQLQLRANALTVWFFRLYAKAGFEDCSSHSGRRSFITEAARKANLNGCSLVDVQKLAGHADLNTTQRYIDVSENQASLVANLWE